MYLFYAFKKSWDGVRRPHSLPRCRWYRNHRVEFWGALDITTPLLPLFFCLSSWLGLSLRCQIRVWAYFQLSFFHFRHGPRIELDSPLVHSFIIYEEANLSEHSSGQAVLNSTGYMMHLKPKNILIMWILNRSVISGSVFQVEKNRYSARKFPIYRPTTSVFFFVCCKVT